MINFGEIFFCEKVIQNPDGSPREIVNRFSRLQVQSYPYLFRSTLVINFTHTEALNHLLAMRIKSSEGEIIFFTAPQPLMSNRPPRPQEVGMITSLPEIEISKPGNYTAEILLNDIVKHVEHLSFA